MLLHLTDRFRRIQDAYGRGLLGVYGEDVLHVTPNLTLLTFESYI